MIKEDYSKQFIDHAASNKIHKRLWVSVLAGIFASSLLIGILTVTLIYRSHSKQLQETLLFNLELQTEALNSELLKLKNLSTQITSRTHIRHKLEQYLQGQTDLDALIEFTKPNLFEALNKTPSIVGITRLDSKGKQLLQVGIEIPQTIWPKHFLSNKLQLGAPGLINGNNTLVISTPIINAKNEPLGIDLVAFDPKNLFKIIQRFIQHQNSGGNTRLGTITPTGIQFFFNSANINHQLKVTFNNKTNALIDNNNIGLTSFKNNDEFYIFAYKKIENTPWVFFFFDEENNFYRLARTNASYVGFVILVITLIGMTLSLFLVRPLAGRISVETNSLRKLLNEHKTLLKKAQLNEQRLQSIIDNTSSVIYLKDNTGKYILINKRFSDLFHLTREEVIGKTDYDVFPTVIADSFRANDLKVINKNRLMELDEQAPHDDGIHDYLSLKFPLYNNKSNSNDVCGISTDITERKQNEKALQMSEERFDLAMQASNDGLWDWEIETNFVYYSPRWMSMLGYKHNELKNTFNTWEKLVDEHGKVKTLALIDECLKGKRNNFSTDFRMRHKDGHWVDILTRGILVRDEQGKPIRVVGTHVDISERIIAQNELKASNLRFQTLFEMSPDPTWIIDHHHFVDCNQAAVNFLGYRSKKELLNKHPSELSPKLQHDGEESFIKAERMMNLAQQKGIHRFEWVHVRADASEFIAEVTLSLIQLQNKPVIYCSWRDITSRKEIENKLHSYQENLESLVAQRTVELEEITSYNRTLFETSPMGLVLCNMNGSLVDANPAFLKIIGYTELESKELSCWDLTPPENEIQEQQLLKSIKETGHYGPHEKEYLCKDGHRVPVKLSGLIIEQEGQQYIWSSVEDITQSKKLHKDLAKARDDAEHLSRVKSEFLANMSHEIRTPMNAIIGMTHLALKTKLNDKQSNYIRNAHSSAKNLLGILNDILDFSKIEAGKLKLETIEFQIPEVIDNLKNIIDLKAKETNIQFFFDIDPKLPKHFIGDPLRLTQILVNLGSNAIKFSDFGTIVKLKVVLQEQSKHEAVLHFSIQDQGIGISLEQQKKLFQSFSQADSSTTREFGGSGLGLVISKKITQLMGGDIWVTSEPGIGSTFHFTVRLHKQTRPAENNLPDKNIDSANANAQLRGAKILIVEDNDINQEYTQELLEQHGMIVKIASHGKQALELLESHEFDGILMDCQMPIMDGYEATRKIREQIRFKTLPIISMTANVMGEDIKKAISAGMNDHIDKPIDPDTMMITMAKWITPRNEAEPQTSIKPNTNPVKIGNLPGIKPDNALVRRNPALFKKLLLKFQNQYQDFEQQFRNAQLNEDMMAAVNTAHSLKGTSGNLSMLEVRATAEELEHACKNQTENIDELLGKVITQLQIVFEGIQLLDTDL